MEDRDSMPESEPRQDAKV